MEPIATYSEVSFEGSRSFTLFPDKIVVRGKLTLVSEFETSIALTSIEPHPDKLLIRNKSFTHGLWMTIVSSMLASILGSGFRLSFTSYAPVVFCTGISGVGLMLATFRKVEFFQFKNNSGTTILDLARSGKSAAKLDSFIEALTKQIRVARGAI